MIDCVILKQRKANIARSYIYSGHGFLPRTGQSCGGWNDPKHEIGEAASGKKAVKGKIPIVAQRSIAASDGVETSMKFDPN